MRLLSPRRYVSSVCSIDLDELKAQGKVAILVDRDNTLVPRDRRTVPNDVARWLQRARALGFSMCMVSNNWHHSEVARSAAELSMDWISFACKPLPFALRVGCRKLGARRDQAVLIGDQLYTDVWAANFAGIDSILVKPQTHVDMWYTHIFRIFERRALADLPCEDEAVR